MKSFSILFMFLLIARISFIMCTKDDPFRRVSGCEYKGGFDYVNLIIECHNLKSVDIEEHLKISSKERINSDHNNHQIMAINNRDKREIKEIKKKYHIRYSGIQFDNNVLKSVFIRRYTYALILERSNIRDIESGAFDSENKLYLKILELHDLNMDSIKSEAFKGLNGLVSLRITKSKLKTIDENTFKLLTSLKHLMISDCPDLKMSFNGQLYLCVLNRFSVSGSDFGTAINKFTFKSFLNLQEIHLPSNKIQSIGAETFTSKSFTSLKRIVLSDNQLKTIPLAAYDFSTISVYLNLNPLHCDCDMEPFRKYIQTVEDLEHSSGMICNSPPSMRGKRLIDCSDLCVKTCDNFGVDNIRFANQFFEKLSCNEYRFDLDDSSSNFVIIEIEDDSEPVENQRSVNCYTGKENENRVKLEVQTNRTHRLCRLGDQTKFSPFDCKPFPPCTTTNVHNEWIDLEHQISTIALSVLIAIFSFLLGFAIIFFYNIKANYEENVYSVIKSRKRFNSINSVSDCNIETIRNFYQGRKVPIVTIDAIMRSLDVLEKVEIDPPQVPPRPSNWTEIVEYHKRKFSSDKC